MQREVFIALGFIIVVFVVCQYGPPLFRICRFMQRGEGFESALSLEMGNRNMITMENAHGSEPAGFTSFPGNVQANLTNSNPHNNPVQNGDPQSKKAAGNELKVQPSSEGFADLRSQTEGPAAFGSAEAPAGCYPRDQLTPAELLPKDMNSIWAEQNPMGPGSLKGKNFLSAGALIGVNTVGQSLRNANLQIRSEPPNPQVPVSIFLQSTIGPDISHRSLEIN